jgi:hypothetical protein
MHIWALYDGDVGCGGARAGPAQVLAHLYTHHVQLMALQQQAWFQALGGSMQDAMTK